MKKLLDKRETIIWICSTCCRVFGSSTAISAFMGHPLAAGIASLLTGAAYELKIMLEKQNPRHDDEG